MNMKDVVLLPEWEEKYNKKSRSKRFGRIKFESKFVSTVRKWSKNRRKKAYGNILSEAKENIGSAIKIEEALQTTTLNDSQKAMLKAQRDEYVGAVSEDKEKAARLVEKMVDVKGLTRDQIMSRHPFIFRLKDTGNKKLGIVRKVLLESMALSPRYREYKRGLSNRVREQVRKRFDNLVDIIDDKLFFSQDGLDQLAKGNVAHSVLSALPSGEEPTVELKPVKFDKPETSPGKSTPSSPATSSARDFILSKIVDSTDVKSSPKVEQPQVSDLSKKLEEATSLIKSLKLELENVRRLKDNALAENAALKTQLEAAKKQSEDSMPNGDYDYADVSVYYEEPTESLLVPSKGDIPKGKSEGFSADRPLIIPPEPRVVQQQSVAPQTSVVETQKAPEGFSPVSSIVTPVESSAVQQQVVAPSDAIIDSKGIEPTGHAVVVPVRIKR